MSSWVPNGVVKSFACASKQRCRLKVSHHKADVNSTCRPSKACFARRAMVSCHVWDAHMGSAIPMTATAVPFYCNWFWILKLVAYPVVAFAAVRLGPSQVASMGLLPKKGVVQVAYSTGIGVKTCSSISCSSASLAMLLRDAPARPQQVFGFLAPPMLFNTTLSNLLWPKLLNNLPGICTASLQSLQQHMEQARGHLQAPCNAGYNTAAANSVKVASLPVSPLLNHWK